MPRHFTYPLVDPAPRVAVYECTESFPAPPNGSETVALPAVLLPLALEWAWAPTHTVVVFTGALAGTLSSRDRDRIWKTWGVPVLEYRLDASGSVIAEECEAHDGLHLRPGPEPSSDLLRARCACGLVTPRMPSASEENTFSFCSAA